jgi:type III secretory pathway component EscR
MSVKGCSRNTADGVCRIWKQIQITCLRMISAVYVSARLSFRESIRRNLLERKSINEQSEISKNSVSARKDFLEKYAEHLSGRFIHFKYYLEKYCDV